MNLKEYLSKKGKAPKGKTQEWLRFCTLDVTTGSLWAGDPHLANADDGCVVKVPNGRYAVAFEMLKAGKYEFDFRIGADVYSALKLTLP